MSDEKLKITKSSGNVFSDLEIPNSVEYLAKSELAMKINNILEECGYTQKQSAEVLGIDQPKISALNCGRLSGFSIERLISFLNKLDRDVEIVVKLKPKNRKTPAYLKVLGQNLSKASRI